MKAVADPVLRFLQENFLLAQQFLGSSKAICHRKRRSARPEDLFRSEGSRGTRDPLATVFCQSAHFRLPRCGLDSAGFVTVSRKDRWSKLTTGSRSHRGKKIGSNLSWRSWYGPGGRNRAERRKEQRELKQSAIPR